MQGERFQPKVVIDGLGEELEVIAAFMARETSTVGGGMWGRVWVSPQSPLSIDGYGGERSELLDASMEYGLWRERPDGRILHSSLF